ncbi:MAG: transposase family protein [Anaerolineaceae bacterium]|nr:transposase family protein [Anaerolineaceae bacterium]
MPVIVLRLSESQSVFNDRPTHCPYCGSDVFQRWGASPKKVQDTNIQTLEVFRYHCIACGHTFRHYPQGIDHTTMASRIRKLAALVWALGLSSREVVEIFKELGIELSNMMVWRDGHELACKYFNGGESDHPSRYKIDKLFLKYRGKGIGTIFILDLGKDKTAVLGKVDETNPRMILTWLEPIIQDLEIKASIFGTDFLDKYNAPSDEVF